MIESLDTDEEIASQLRAMMRRFRAFLRNLIEDGRRCGRFRRDVDPETLAADYTSSILGAEIQFYQDPERFPFDRTVNGYIDRLLATIRPAA